MRSLPGKYVAHALMCAVVVVAVVAAGCAVESRAQGASRRASASGADTEAPLTNAAIVKLVRAKFSEKTIVAIIRARPAQFDLSPDRLIELKKSGVGERIILTMLARAEGDALSATDDAGDAFADDPFFDGMSGRTTHAPEAGKPSNGQGDPNEVNIFGSSGGARGRTRSRTGGGAAEGDTRTTGSASVRILRTPPEPGGSNGAQPRLERTPTLTNDSIIELVEAGFSEGTIIRRIDSSPVAFDFAPAKLAELRRRRVGEPVIAAMRAAMSEEGEGVR